MRVTVVFVETPLAVLPLVAISSEHGLIVMVVPAGMDKSDEALGLKMQEPKVIGPVAVCPPLVMVKLPPENETVVGPAVPNSGTPPGKLKLWPFRACKKAGPVVGLRAMLALLVATGVGTVVLPPPQAANVATEAARNKVCKIFEIFMGSLFNEWLCQGESA